MFCIQVVLLLLLKLVRDIYALYCNIHKVLSEYHV